MDGRAVLVTGASRGIGRATALAFAGNGDRVAIHHRDSEELARQLLAELPGTGHLVVRGDVSDAGQAQRVVEEAASHLGGLEVLVNNAGVSLLHDITEMDFEKWRQAFDRTVAVNLSGAAYVTYFAVRHMLGRVAPSSTSPLGARSGGNRGSRVTGPARRP